MVGMLGLPGKDQWNRVYSPEGLAPTLVSMQGGRQEPKIKVIDDQGRIKGEYKQHDIVPCLRAQTHGNPPKVIDALYNNRQPREYEDAAPTIRSSHDTLKVSDGFRIRKLTPLECWRLQGFPDWAFHRAKEAGVSDSQLYKQAGNSVTVNVTEVIGRAIVE